jgi:hypothetical protein
MIAAKKKPELSELDKIRAIADEIRRHQDRMLELITEEAEIDKAAHPSLPLVMLVQDIQKRGRCPCEAMLARLNQRAMAAELKERQRDG